MTEKKLADSPHGVPIQQAVPTIRGFWVILAVVVTTFVVYGLVVLFAPEVDEDVNSRLEFRQKLRSTQIDQSPP